ncbi:hypothetical protein [Massilia sp. erpn]|uniref:hypothetical protein n=1 Tax=Massilia sp. erpn TaxID=2738142 RepID=UPI002107A0DB|nr:hypothetical protein [Massilia sp. erpn]UTY55856.1 hypothetical protein HPQ68_00845 [Massilia sp. erpn]
MKSKVFPGARLRLIQLAAAVMSATALAACGGGGSGNTVVEKPGMGLYTTAPNQVTVAAGATSTYTIGGGGGTAGFVSYKASSSNEQVATVKVDKTSLIITGHAGGTAAIQVVDSAGANVVINVTVPNTHVSGLAIAVPPGVTLVPGNTAQYKINGGIGPFTAVASNPNVVALAAGLDSVSVTAANPGTATVVVYDRTGASAKFDLTVAGGSESAALYTTAPEAFFMPANATASYKIAGGLGPYTVTSADTGIADATVESGILTVRSKGAAGKTAIHIRDAKGALLVITANVSGNSGVPLYTTAPSAVAIGLGAAPAYTIQGGIAPFTATSSNAGVAKASVSGNTLNLTGLNAGVADVVIFDSTGASVKITATVQGGSATVPLYSTAPQSITVAVGATPTYTIAGGASPYTVTSSNVKVVTVSQTGTTFTATGVSAGPATITIHDANGSAVNIVVAVQ